MRTVKRTFDPATELRIVWVETAFIEPGFELPRKIMMRFRTLHVGRLCSCSLHAIPNGRTASREAGIAAGLRMLGAIADLGQHCSAMRCGRSPCRHSRRDAGRDDNHAATRGEAHTRNPACDSPGCAAQPSSDFGRSVDDADDIGYAFAVSICVRIRRRGIGVTRHLESRHSAK